MPGVRQDQEQSIDAAVTVLERQPALEGLQVGGPNLRFHPDGKAPQACHGVPCALITIPWQRDFRPPGCPFGEQIMETTEELAVALIAERLSAGEGAHAQVQPDDREQDGQQSETDVTRDAPLDLAHP